jgi:hypothetical protein
MGKYTKYIAIGLLILFLLSSLMGCSIRTSRTASGKIPPGQAKKISGSQSAKNYAPGHNK